MKRSDARPVVKSVLRLKPFEDRVAPDTLTDLMLAAAVGGRSPP
jgi:hypothetical protein